MAPSYQTFEAERDIRHAAKERKRDRDHNTKWAHGQRHLPGVNFNLWGSATTNHTNQQLAKFRPNKKPSDYNGGYAKPHQNFGKGRAHWAHPSSQFRSRLHAKSEIQETLSGDWANAPLSSPSLSRSMTAASDPFLYSFDRTDTPGRPLTLEVFVKTPTGKETEKLVEREYAVVDGNGESVSGRKATRRVLRTGTSAAVQEEQSVIEDEGFELI